MKKTLHINKDFIFYFILFLVGMVCFGFLGETGYQWYKDSNTYANIKAAEGVMPIYPIFLYINQKIFGDMWKEVVVWEQVILASLCVMNFVGYMKKQFGLKIWEVGLVYIACLLPFSIELPGYMVSHMILTEGIAYPLFYLFMKYLLRAVFEISYKNFCRLLGMAFILSLTRSQLQLLYIICAAVFLYISLKQNKKDIKFRKVLFSIGASVLLILMCVFVTMKTFGFYINQVSSYLADDSGENSDTKEKAISGAQFNSVIFNRGFFEADETDENLFVSEEDKEIFSILFEAIDKEQARYSYAEPGLWMWKQLRTGDVGVIGFQVLVKYYEEKEPGLVSTALYNQISEKMAYMGGKVLVTHFGRYIYHSVRLMIPSLINTVFFQVESIYLLCHIIMAFLYASAICMCFIYRFQMKKKSQAVDYRLIEYMAVVIIINVIFAGVSNFIFEGIQRYVVYAFGIFYIAYYLIFRQIVTEWINSKKEKKHENISGDTSL